MIKKFGSIFLAILIVMQIGYSASAEDIYATLPVADLLPSEEKNLTIDLGNSYVVIDTNNTVGDDDIPGDKLIRVEKLGSNSKVDLSATIGNNSSYNDDRINLSDCLYTFEEVSKESHQYKIYSQTGGNSKIYLSFSNAKYSSPGIPNHSGDDNGSIITITNNTNKTNSFNFIDGNSYLYFYSDGRNKFDRYNSSVSQTAMFMYSYSVVDNKPVYTKINSLDDISGGYSLLICAEVNGTMFALRPNVGENVYNHVAKITPYYTTGSTTLAFYETDLAKGGDTTSLILGNTKYNFTIKDTTVKPTNICSENKTVTVEAGKTAKISIDGLALDTADLNTTNTGIVSFEATGTHMYDTKVIQGGTNRTVWASDCLYTFNKNAGSDTYTVSAKTSSGTDIYLNITGTAPQTTSPAIISVHHIEGSTKYRVTDVTNGKDFYFNGWLNFNGNSRTSYDDVKEMYLYEKVDEKGSDELPGFKKATEISDGGQYLIVATCNIKKDSGDPYKTNETGYSYILYPSTETNGNNRNYHVVTVTNDYREGSTDFVISGLSVGSTKIKKDEFNVLNINVVPTAIDVPKESEVFVTKQGYQCDQLNKLTKLTISENLSYKLSLTDNILNNASDIGWFTSDPELINIIRNDNNALTIRIGEIEGDEIRNEYIGVGYKLNDKVYSYKLPVRIMPVKTDATTFVYDMYIAQADNTIPYYSINGETITGDDGAVVRSEVGEAICMSIETERGQFIDFFGAPEEGYALTYIKDYGGSAGLYDKIDDFINSTAGSNQINQTGKDNVTNMINDAKKVGCDGALGYSKQNTSVQFAIAFASDKLPTINVSPKEIIKSDGTKVNIGNGGYKEFAHVGDTVYFEVQVINHASNHGIVYQKNEDGGLSTALDGAYFAIATDSGYYPKTDSDRNYVNRLPIYDTLNADDNQESTHTYYIAYKIKEDDIGKGIINKVVLNEKYKTQYSGDKVIDAVEEVEAKINVIAGKIEPETNESIGVTTPIELPGNGEQITPGEVWINKIYYVKPNVVASLTNFAGTNDVDCVGGVYHITDENGINVTNAFEHDDSDGRAMLYTYKPGNDGALGERNYVVAYLTAENGEDAWKMYAIKIVPMSDKIAGSTLTIGSKIGLNYFVNFATVDDAITHSAKFNTKIDSQGNKQGVVVTYSDPNPADYRMRFNNKMIVGYADKTANGSDDKTYYGYSYEGINAYELGMNVKGELLNAEDQAVCSKENYSVQKYAESMISKERTSEPLKNMLKKMLVYGAFAEQYAYEKGWISNTSDNVNGVQKYSTDTYVKDLVEPVKEELNNTSGTIVFNSVGLTMEEGMSLSMKVLFKNNSENENEYPIKLKAGEGSVAKFDDITKDSDGVFTIPYRYFGNKDGFKILHIKDIPPFHWSDGYVFYAEDSGPENGFKYSVNTYCANMYHSEEATNEEALKSLVKAMYNYGQAANAWYSNATN